MSEQAQEETSWTEYIRQARAARMAILHATISGIEFSADDELQVIHLRTVDSQPMTLRFDGYGDAKNITLVIGKNLHHLGVV